MTVEDAPFSVTANNQSTTEGQALTNVVVGTITDTNTLVAASNFTASIQWGDGSTTSGTLVQTGAGTYNVVGSHTYLHSGDKTMNVVVTGDGGGSQTGSATATVGNATPRHETNTSGCAGTPRLHGQVAH